MVAVSVIVPVYNVEEYLEKCIKSILEQTFLDFELILIDDGSSDRSGSICDEYKEKDDRIIVIHKQNEGVSVARNVALDIAQGEYIMFCDGDDFWKSELLEQVYFTMTTHNSDCTIFNFDKIYGDQIIEGSHFKSGITNIHNAEQRLNYYVNMFFRYNHGVEVWSRMFKRDIIDKNHLRFCTTCNNFAEDLGFIAKYCLYVKKIISMPESFYNYTVREGSMMNTSREKIKLSELNEVSHDFCMEYSKVFCETNWKKHFCVLHYLIMYNQYCKIIGTEKYPFLENEIKNIQRIRWYKKQNRKLLKNYNILKSYFGTNDAQRILLFTNYCQHRSGFL